jgi:uncharacterized membrane protein YciS (DUF1049 family)
MIERAWQWIKLFLSDHVLHAGAEHILLVLFIIGAAIGVIMLGFLLFKTHKEIKQLDKDKRKRDKQILKFLSERKNKTY